MVDWMYWVTAVVFTVFGFFCSLSFSKKLMVQMTIDSLIDQGFIKTRGEGENIQLVKYDE